MLKLLIVLTLGSGLAQCRSHRSPCKSDPCTCYSNDDCDGDVCFFGTCQNAGYNIQAVYIDILPPANSGLPPQAYGGNPHDLSAGSEFDIRLQSAQLLRGVVVSASGANLGGIVAAHVHGVNNTSTNLPSATTSQQTVVNPSSEFFISLIPGRYDFLFTPSQQSGPLPPQSLTAYSFDGVNDLTMGYPDKSLVSLRGTVVNSSTSASFVAGAEISGMGLDQNRLLWTASSKAVSDGGGAYTLIFLPGANDYNVTVRPSNPPLGSALVPVMEFSDLTPQSGNLPSLVLAVPPQPVNLSLHVVDPNADPLVAASVFFDGIVGDVLNPGAFNINGTTDARGLLQVALIAGAYNINIVPQGNDNTAALNTSVCVVGLGPPQSALCRNNIMDGGSLNLAVGLKIQVSGTVYSHQGEPVSSARVTYTPGVNASRRMFAASTDSNGFYSVGVDPASANDSPIDYAVGVEPDLGAALPRHLEYIQVGSENVSHNVTLFAPSFVFGTVLDPNGVTMSNVTVAFYLDNPAFPSQPLLVGIAQSTADGEFIVPLPTAGNSF